MYLQNGTKNVLYNDKRVKPLRNYSNYKYLYTQLWRTLIYKANTIRTKRRNEEQYNNSWGL